MIKKNNCKAVKEINKRLWKRLLRKHILAFLGYLSFFALACLLFLQFKSGDEVHKNKSIIGKENIKAINIVDYGGRGGHRRKNKIRNINKDRNRINKNIKKRTRRTRGKSVSKKKKEGKANRL